MGFIRAISRPDIGRHLLRDEDEVIVDEVAHHGIAYTLPVAEVVAAVALLVLVVFGPATWSLFPLVAAGGLVAHAGWRSLVVSRDRFVVTNMRVFRISGVLSQRVATMPLSRILDITVDKPLLGRLLRYGHFVFESAAQEQGLRDIRYVGRPDDRDKTIQRLLASQGLRGQRSPR